MAMMLKFYWTAFYKGTIKSKVADELKSLRGIKFQLVLEAELTKQKADGEDVIAVTRFNHKTTTVTNKNQVQDEIKEAKSEILKRIENYMKEGSG